MQIISDHCVCCGLPCHLSEVCSLRHALLGSMYNLHLEERQLMHLKERRMIPLSPTVNWTRNAERSACRGLHESYDRRTTDREASCMPECDLPSRVLLPADVLPPRVRSPALSIDPVNDLCAWTARQLHVGVVNGRASGACTQTTTYKHGLTLTTRCQ